jgi:hypothetical protein
VDVVMTEPARRALDLVERDAGARAAFVAAYTGEGDAIAALRARVAPDDSTDAAHERELDALRRTAFGRTTSPVEAARAAEAHALLARADESRAAAELALDAAIAAVLPDGTAPRHGSAAAGTAPDAARVDDSAAHGRGIPSRWRRLVPAGLVLGGCALGAGVAVAVSASLVVDQPENAVITPGALAIPPQPDESEVRGGDLEAAERWLQRVPTEADAIPVPLEDIVPESSRLVSGGKSDGTVWVAREVDGALCLVVAGRVNGALATSCATPEEFVERGAMVALNEGMAGVPSIGATWDGAHVYVTVGSE